MQLVLSRNLIVRHKELMQYRLSLLENDTSESTRAACAKDPSLLEGIEEERCATHQQSLSIIRERESYMFGPEFEHLLILRSKRSRNTWWCTMTMVGTSPYKRLIKQQVSKLIFPFALVFLLRIFLGFVVSDSFLIGT
jgi:hypothetical protein